MGNITEKFDEVTHYKVIRAYLKEGKSHRRIQEDILNIPAPARGGGFIAMQILHTNDIDGTKKNILQNRLLTEELKCAKGNYKKALEIIQRYE